MTYIVLYIIALLGAMFLYAVKLDTILLPHKANRYFRFDKFGTEFIYEKSSNHMMYIHDLNLNICDRINISLLARPKMNDYKWFAYTLHTMNKKGIVKKYFKSNLLK